MLPDAPVSDLERRKMVRLRVRGDLDVTPQKYEGRTYYVIKDPVSLRYYRFKEQEYFLLKLMDGAHTNDQAQKLFEQRFRPDRLTLEDLEQFSQQLLTAGLVQNDSAQAGKQLFDRRKKRLRMEFLQNFTNILYIKVPVFDPERLLSKMLPYLRWMFTTWFLLASVTFMLAAIMLVLTHFETFLDRLPSYHEFFSFKTVVYLWAALGVVKVIHEFGHGLSCKAFGGEVHEMGFLILCLSPAMYCNVSDAWTLPNKWKRIIISGAGIYVELMIAAAATFVWWNTPSQPFVNYLSLSLMIVCSVSTVVFNGNPLMRYDGYYVLADWLEIPNLRDRSNRYIQRLAMEHCLGIEVQPEPYMELHRRILFVTYAVISWVYRWAITFVILKFMANWLKPYKLEIISSMLAMAALASMLGWPLFRLIKGIRKRGRLPDMKSVRVAITAAAIAAVLLGFFFLPLPVSRVRQPGLVQVQPEYQDPVYVKVSGNLQELYVKEGKRVKKGDFIAKLYDLDLDTRYQQAKIVAEYKRRLINEVLDNPQEKPKDARSREMLMSARIQAMSEMKSAETAMGVAETALKALYVVAPRDGVVMNLPTIDDIGKRWETRDEGSGANRTPFCVIGDPGKLRVLVPLPPSDYSLVKENVDKLGKLDALPVTIRVQGRTSDTWKGTIAILNQDEAKEIPPALSNKGGGPLAVKPGSESSGKFTPQSQVFLVGINFDHPDDAIVPGSLAHVKIHCEYRSAAWWSWRTISDTFNLGLSF